MNHIIKFIIVSFFVLGVNYTSCEAKLFSHPISDTIKSVGDTLVYSPEEIVQKQLEAYNAKDIEAFLFLYSENVKAYNFPDKEIFSGKKAMRAGYESFFKENPDLFCVVSQRMVMGNVVVDYETITGLSNGIEIKSIAIFNIEKGKINRIYFLRN